MILDFLFYQLMGLLSDAMGLILSYLVLLFVPPLGFITGAFLIFFEYVTAENIMKDAEKISLKTAIEFIKKNESEDIFVGPFQWAELVEVFKKENAELKKATNRVIVAINSVKKLKSGFG